MVVVIVVAAVILFLFLLPEDAGYAESGSRPPWVWIYWPQIVDTLISQSDVFRFGFGFGFLSAEALVGGAAWFLAEQAACRTVWLVELGTVGSFGGTGKAYL